jgi:hypothetical protein
MNDLRISCELNAVDGVRYIRIELDGKLFFFSVPAEMDLSDAIRHCLDAVKDGLNAQ